MFVKENKHKLNMDFDTFLRLLARIADIKYQEQENVSQSLYLLIANHFLPLYDNIMRETDLGDVSSLLHFRSLLNVRAPPARSCLLNARAS